MTDKTIVRGNKMRKIDKTATTHPAASTAATELAVLH